MPDRLHYAAALCGSSRINIKQAIAYICFVSFWNIFLLRSTA